MPRNQLSAKDPARPGSANPLPFAPLPHEAVTDSRLCAGDRDALSALLYFAQQAKACSPTNRQLMDRLDAGRRTIQDRLKRLRKAGWIDYDPARNPRVIILTWRCNGSAPHAAYGTPDAVIRTAPMRPTAPTPCVGPHAPPISIEEERDEEQQQEADGVVVDSDRVINTDGEGVPEWYDDVNPEANPVVVEFRGGRYVTKEVPKMAHKTVTDAEALEESPLCVEDLLGSLGLL